MAIKITISANSDKNITYYQKKFWKIFLWNGAVGLFFLIRSDFWFDAFFEDLENQTQT
jgi:hypothetical protein